MHDKGRYHVEIKTSAGVMPDTGEFNIYRRNEHFVHEMTRLMLMFSQPKCYFEV